ncbi:cytochrome P450 [Streptomyces mirabilis]|jgi:cytochrome P450|uniref:Cytochrome P450 n=1 Tax=Streptomyces mirabilis TaxID=68239 RepID=A0A1I2YBA5_9ACTN|nr:cytochrome P450 [Streptomyces mirabilis]SFH22963.1 Cytochrome P450 [Streptomyces mirabilis]
MLDGKHDLAVLYDMDVLPEIERVEHIKMFIGGGLNEPRDATAVGTYALLAHPEQRAEADPARFAHVFEEAVRWVAPIGQLGGVTLPAGARLGVVLGSANRDETVFDAPDTFDINRRTRPHLAFDGGPHFCLGTWTARAQVGQVSLPTLLRCLPGLRLSDSEPVRWGG